MRQKSGSEEQDRQGELQDVEGKYDPSSIYPKLEEDVIGIYENAVGFFSPSLNLTTMALSGMIN